MKPLNLLAALAGFGCILHAVACAEDLPALDAMTGRVTTGEAFANWAPTDPDDARVFDLGASLQIKEAVGVAIDAQGYWSQGSDDPTLRYPLEGVLSAESTAADVVEVFSAPNGGFALLAHEPGTATVVFTSAGHPGTFSAKVTVVPDATFVDVVEVAPEAPEEADAGSDATTDDGGLSR